MGSGCARFKPNCAKIFLKVIKLINILYIYNFFFFFEVKGFIWTPEIQVQPPLVVAMFDELPSCLWSVWQNSLVIRNLSKEFLWIWLQAQQNCSKLKVDSELNWISLILFFVNYSYRSMWLWNAFQRKGCF